MSLHGYLLTLNGQEKPIPSKLWSDLKQSGWQRKVTRPSHYNSKIGKLYLWTMEHYDWILYMESDVFVVRSIVPLVTSALLGNDSIWAIPYDWNDSFFSTSIMMFRPSVAQYDIFMQRMNYSSSEEVLLNAAYSSAAGNWSGKWPPQYGLDLAAHEQVENETQVL
jgi:hypothetical protein